MKPTIKIFGCCVTRDALAYNPQNKNFDNTSFDVQKFVNFISSYTLLTGEPLDLPVDKILSNSPQLNNFALRCLCLDAQKTCFNYFFDNDDNSEWLLIDVGNERLRTMEWENKNFILSYSTASKSSVNIIKSILGEDDPKILQPWENNQQAHILRFNRVLDKLLARYHPEQIVLNKFNATLDYISNTGELLTFNSNDILIYKKWNELFAKFNSIVEERLPGCHIIEPPDNLISDAKNRWGLAPLHYNKLYYEYVEKALVIIFHKFNKNYEKSELEKLRLLYSEKFALLREKTKILTVRKDRDKWRNYSNTFKNLIIKNLLLCDENICQNFVKEFINKGYYHISIYGDTEITKVLLHILKKSSIKVDYVVESAAHPIDGVVTVDRSLTNYANCDVMLIADIYNYQDIKDKLERLKVPFPCINAMDFLSSLQGGDNCYIKIQNKIQDLNTKLEEAKCLINKSDTEKRKIELNQYATKQRLDLVINTINSIKESFSYKLGRFLTFIPRKIQNIFKKK